MNERFLIQLNKSEIQYKDALELHGLEPIFHKMPNKELNVLASFKNICVDLIRWNFMSQRNDFLKIKVNYFILKIYFYSIFLKVTYF